MFVFRIMSFRCSPKTTLNDANVKPEVLGKVHPIYPKRSEEPKKKKKKTKEVRSAKWQI